MGRMLDNWKSQAPVVRGRNITIGITMEDLYEYNQPIDLIAILAAAAKVDVTSSSTADAAASTGALTVELVGVDSTYKLISEIITMTGQTAVTSAKAYRRVLSAEVLTSGTGRTNAGDIHIVKTGTSTWTTGVPDTVTSALCKILAGHGISANGMFCVGVGKGYKIIGINVAAITQAAMIEVVIQDVLGTNNTQIPVMGPFMVPASAVEEFYSFDSFGMGSPNVSGGFDIKIRALGIAASANVAATLKIQRVL